MKPDKFETIVDGNGNVVIVDLYNEMGMFLKSYQVTHVVEKNGYYLLCDKNGLIAKVKSNHSILQRIEKCIYKKEH